MDATAVLYALFFLATAIFAAPTGIQATSPPFQITDLHIEEVQGYNTSISFMVHDPDPLTNATQKCTGSWETGSGGYPQGSYETCGNSSFAWNMASYNNIESFVLGIEHVFEDPAIGEYPYDQVITYGKGNVTTPNIWCFALANYADCWQPYGNTIKAPIYAETA